MLSIGSRTILGLSVLCIAPACAPDAEPRPSGSIGMELAIAPGVHIDAIDWSLLGASVGFFRSGTIDVRSSSSSVSFLIGGLPADPSYRIRLEAVSPDGAVTCAGEAFFDVAAGNTSSASVALVCSPTVLDSTGAVVIDGTAEACAHIESIGVSRFAAPIGGSIILTAEVSAAVPALFSWTASAGTLVDAHAASPTFTCPPTPGDVDVTLTIAPGSSLCPTRLTQSVILSCVADAPTFGSVYASVLGPKCASCHSPGDFGVTFGQLDMSSLSVAYSNIVGVAAAGSLGTAGVNCNAFSPPLVRVVPGDAASSLLVNKIQAGLSGTLPFCGTPMPFFGPALSVDEVQLIRDWVDAGARFD